MVKSSEFATEDHKNQKSIILTKGSKQRSLYNISFFLLNTGFSTIDHVCSFWNWFTIDTLWVDPTEAPAAVLASAVLQTWRRHNRHRGPCDRGSVAVNGADFLNALDQEEGGVQSAYCSFVRYQNYFKYL